MQHTRAESPGRRLCSCRLPAVAALRRERARMRRTHFATKLIHEHKRRDCRRGRADTHTRNIGGSTSHARHGVNVGPGLCPASPGFTRLHPASRHRASPARLVALWGLAGACRLVRLVGGWGLVPTHYVTVSLKVAVVTDTGYH